MPAQTARRLHMSGFWRTRSLTKVLIPHDLSQRKYYPDADPLPYEATGEKLRDEIRRRAPDIDLRLAADESATLAALDEAEVLITYRIRSAWLERAPHLRWIQSASAGIDHVFKVSDVAADDLRRRGIMLTNAAGLQRLVIGEQVMACILAFSRGLLRSFRQKAERRWRIFAADELAGCTIGIIGLGGIGSRVAELGKAFGTWVIGTQRDPSRYSGPADRVLSTAELPELLEAADHVVVACPLTDQTRGLIGAGAFGRMKRTAHLINVARGEIVDEAALIEALKTRRIAGAALDVFGRPGPSDVADVEALPLESELWDLDNVIITPNNASGTPRFYEHLAELFLRNLWLVQRGQEPPGRVL